MGRCNDMPIKVESICAVLLANEQNLFKSQISVWLLSWPKLNTCCPACVNTDLVLLYLSNGKIPLGQVEVHQNIALVLIKEKKIDFTKVSCNWIYISVSVMNFIKLLLNSLPFCKAFYKYRTCAGEKIKPCYYYNYGH